MSNPNLYLDTNGDTIRIFGPLSQTAFCQLANSTELNIQINEAGLSTLISDPSGPLVENDQILLSAIQDETHFVDITATDENRVIKGGSFFMGGAFIGSTENSDGTVNASQVVNPNHMKIKEDFIGQRSGVTMVHETIEAYIGSVDSPGAEPNSPGYLGAHNKANSAGARRNIPFSYPREIKNFNAKTGKGDFYFYVENGKKERTLLFKEEGLQLAQPEN